MTKNKSPNRILTLISVIVIQLCVGIAYIWSVFQSGIAQSLFGGNNASASLPYSILLAILSAGSIIGGILASKISIKYVVMIGGFIISLGFFLASFTTPQFPEALWLTYGVLGGIGMGFVYSPSIACVQKCFPDKKGLVTGLVVAGLGLGGVVFTPIVESIITYYGGVGNGELMAFRIIAVIFLVVCTVGSLFLSTPKVAATSAVSANIKDLRPTQVLKSPMFYLITLSMMLACMSGLMMIGFAKPIAIGRGMVETASIGVLMISLSNAAGRLVWGMVSDKIGRINTLVILMLGAATMSLLVNFAQGALIFVLIAFVGFFYGGFLSTFPSLTAEAFGPKNVAINYGMVLIGFGFAAIIASYIAGVFLNLADGDMDKMFPAFAIAATCALIGVGIILIVKKMLNNKKID